MTLNYDILKDEKLVLAKGAGTVTLEEILDHFEALRKDARYQPPMKKLVDYRQVQQFQISVEDEKVLSKKKAAFDQIFYNEKCAIVAPSDLLYGMARMHGALMSEAPVDVEVVRDIRRAVQWLDLAETDILAKLNDL